MARRPPPKDQFTPPIATSLILVHIWILCVWIQWFALTVFCMNREEAEELWFADSVLGGSLFDWNVAATSLLHAFLVLALLLRKTWRERALDLASLALLSLLFWVFHGVMAMLDIP